MTHSMRRFASATVIASTALLAPGCFMMPGYEVEEDGMGEQAPAEDPEDAEDVDEDGAEVDAEEEEPEVYEPPRAPRYVGEYELECIGSDGQRMFTVGFAVSVPPLLDGFGHHVDGYVIDADGEVFEAEGELYAVEDAATASLSVGDQTQQHQFLITSAPEEGQEETQCAIVDWVPVAGSGGGGGGGTSAGEAVIDAAVCVVTLFLGCSGGGGGGGGPTEWEERITEGEGVVHFFAE